MKDEMDKLAEGLLDMEKDDMEKLAEGLLNMAEGFMRVAKRTRKDNPNASLFSWKRAKLLEKAAKALEGRTPVKPVKPELEGGGYTWWLVCNECHTTISRPDRFCRQCGRLIEWEK